MYESINFSAKTMANRKGSITINSAFPAEKNEKQEPETLNEKPGTNQQKQKLSFKEKFEFEQLEKELPQLQEEVAFGFLMTKREPSSPSW